VNPRNRVFRAVLGLIVLSACGAAGFAVLEDMGWLEAVYMSVTTISTVGYGDIVPVTPAGRIFSILLIAGGVGMALYLASLIAGDVLEGRLRDFYHRSSMMREINKLRDHVIVCGFGRFGRVVVEELTRAGRHVVVIESDADLIPELENLGVEYIIGSAADDDVLESAGIKRADALVAGVSGEAIGVFIALSARELCPEIRIHARGESEAAVRRLRRAGADFVSSPYQMGGMQTAASILRPSVVDFLDLSLPNSKEEIDLEEIHVGEDSKLTGLQVLEIERYGAKLRIIALKRQSQSIELVPPPELKVVADDHLVVIGEREDLSRLARLALPPQSPKAPRAGTGDEASEEAGSSDDSEAQSAPGATTASRR
jgi:voltage-gated potassium channel